MPRPETKLVHPKMMEALAPSWANAKCTVQGKGAGRNAVGEEQPNDYSNVDPYVDLPCRLSSAGNLASSGEQRSGVTNITVDPFTLMIWGYHDGITANHRVIVDGDMYYISEVIHDSEKTVTICNVSKGPRDA